MVQLGQGFQEGAAGQPFAAQAVEGGAHGRAGEGALKSFV
jgi:hypothetical protein